MTPVSRFGPLALDLQLMTGAKHLPEAAAFSQWCEATLNAVGSPRRSLVIRLVEAAEIRQLNRDFRGMDRVTNVLSFPFDPIPQVEEHWLGDVVVCASVVADEAQAQGRPLRDHWMHIVVHGLLHLCGFDHVGEAEAKVMETLEDQILKTLGCPDPYRIAGLAKARTKGGA